MLARIRKARENDEGGFTLIELLVVMIIIGILAAIAIPAFLNQKQKARDTSAKSDVTTIGKEIAAYYVDGAAALTAAGDASTAPASWTLSVSGTGGAQVATGKLSTGNVVTTGTISNADTFCVSVKNSATGAKAYKYNQNGLAEGAC
jgi:type IV pilus assembly protein PilA